MDALLKELKSVTSMLVFHYSFKSSALAGVDPEQGYAQALLDISHRMQNSAKVVGAELRVLPAKSDEAGLVFGPEVIAMPLAETRARYIDFF